jgi:non-canonical (house-cleaning) NTP pyrophosphatase
MKISVGTTNKRKLEAVKSVITEMDIHKNFEVVGFEADSGVADTPLNEQTILGALNRAKSVLKAHPEQDMYIGIESGLVSRYSDFYEEVWVVVIYEKNVYAAYSSGIKLPRKVADELLPDVQNHIKIMEKLRNEGSMDTHPVLGADTWGNYTGNKIPREVGIKEAFRNALVQIFPGDKSFYLD